MLVNNIVEVLYWNLLFFHIKTLCRLFYSTSSSSDVHSKQVGLLS